MPLILRVQSYREQAPGPALEARFGRDGGTIGRGEACGLCLPDPDKTISRVHCRVGWDGQYYTITDAGSNPSWINGRPLGAGRVAALADGDLLAIGDYVLRVALEQDAPMAAMHEGEADTLAGAAILDTGPGIPATDPLGFRAEPAVPAFRGSEPDHAPPQFAPLPAAAAKAPGAPPMLIPDDYDPLTDEAPPLPARVAASPAPAPAPVAESPAPAPARAGVAAPSPVPARVAVPRQPDSPSTPAPAPLHGPDGAGGDDVLRALLRGLGLPDLKSDLEPAELAELVGAMLREATAGTMAVLLTRSMTKRESRIETTMIGAQANNPLKFFPDAQSALAQMLARRSPGYMAPHQAFGSAFDDLRAHEMAVIAGMRAALAAVLERFDPAAIEREARALGVMDKLLGAGGKARMWDRMAAQYEEVAREAQDGFERLFGERFSAAYRDQVGRVEQAKQAR